MKPQVIVGVTVFGLCLAATTLFVKAAYEVKNVYQNRFEGIKVEQASSKLRQLDCLALNIYKEAGHEPFEGKVGVAQVTINRSNSNQFPKDICDVVYQKSVVLDKVVCQFSWFCDTKHRLRPIDKTAYNECYEVAKKVYLEGFRLTSLTEALYYHADYVNPRWNKVRVAKFGKHIFYK